jgi:predicted nucleotidyltransferase
MTTREYIICTIELHKKELMPFGVRKVGLFGSYARGEQTVHSDIDILVDLDPEKETFDNFMDICDYLEQLFKNEKVEVVTSSGLSKYIGPKILNEVKYV